MTTKSFQKSGIVIVLFLLSSYGFSQHSFIKTKDNQRIVMDDSLITVDHWYKKIEYNEVGTKKRNKVKFEDVQEMQFNNYNLQPYPIEDKNEGGLYFKIVETDGKKLIGYSRGKSSTSLGGSFTRYHYFIIDDNNKVLENLEFDDNYGDKWAKKRDEIEVVLRKYFSGCSEFIGRLNEHDPKAMNLQTQSKMAQKFANKFDKGNAKVFQLFNNPKYSNCDAASHSVETVVETQNIATTQYDATYKYGVINVSYGSSRNDFKIPGLCVIKDGFVDISHKDGSVRYKIKAVKDGNIYCEDKSMTHILKIESETGKLRGFAYDTKITFVADKGMGGATSYYYATKQ